MDRITLHYFEDNILKYAFYSKITPLIKEHFKLLYDSNMQFYEHGRQLMGQW